MLSREVLIEYGAKVDEGLARCMNNETFYFRLIRMAVANDQFGELEESLKKGNLDRAFELTHAMKGVFGNLSLTPLFEPINAMTNYLRSRTEMDYMPLFEEADRQFRKLAEIVAS